MVPIGGRACTLSLPYFLQRKLTLRTDPDLTQNRKRPAFRFAQELGGHMVNDTKWKGYLSTIITQAAVGNFGIPRMGYSGETSFPFQQWARVIKPGNRWIDRTPLMEYVSDSRLNCHYS
jgi:hypothetical protein